MVTPTLWPYKIISIEKLNLIQELILKSGKTYNRDTWLRFIYCFFCETKPSVPVVSVINYVSPHLLPPISASN